MSTVSQTGCLDAVDIRWVHVCVSLKFIDCVYCVCRLQGWNVSYMVSQCSIIRYFKTKKFKKNLPTPNLSARAWTVKIVHRMHPKSPFWDPKSKHYFLGGGRAPSQSPPPVGRGHFLPPPHPVGACGTSILSPMALDLGACGASSLPLFVHPGSATCLTWSTLFSLYISSLILM